MARAGAPAAATRRSLARASPGACLGQRGAADRVAAAAGGPGGLRRAERSRWRRDGGPRGPRPAFAGGAAALTAMAWAAGLGSLAGAALLAGVSCSATAACVAAWLAEDLRAAAVDASTPGWAALKRLLGPPDGEVVLRDGRIVKRGVVVADV